MGRRTRALWAIGSYVLTLLVGLFSNLVQGLRVKLAVSIVGFVLALGLFYEKHHRPTVEIERQKMEKFCETFLFPRLTQAYKLQLRSVYEEEFGKQPRSKRQRQLQEVIEGLRFNVMLYKHRDYRPWGPEWVAKLKPWEKSLMIELDSGAYSIAEKNLKWPAGVGCCGHAIEKQKPYAGDICHKSRQHWNVPATYQESIPDDLGSVLSIPIYRQTRDSDETRGPIVAVLNVDSTHCVRQTHFQDEDVSNRWFEWRISSASSSESRNCYAADDCTAIRQPGWGFQHNTMQKYYMSSLSTNRPYRLTEGTNAYV